MRRIRPHLTGLIVVAACLGLTACGGGGGSSTSSQATAISATLQRGGIQPQIADCVAGKLTASLSSSDLKKVETQGVHALRKLSSAGQQIATSATVSCATPTAPSTGGTTPTTTPTTTSTESTSTAP